MRFGTNLKIPLLPGSGHQTYMDAIELLILPAIRDFNPDLIEVACGLDANAFDPLSRLQAHSGTFREMTRMTMEAEDDICEWRGRAPPPELMVVSSALESRKPKKHMQNTCGNTSLALFLDIPKRFLVCAIGESSRQRDGNSS